jgi:hypothetical protein
VAIGFRWSLVQPAFREHLENEGCRREHITRQLTKVRNHMKPWLNVMSARTRRRLLGAVLLGLAANFAYGFAHYDQHGAHLLPSALIGFLVAAGAFYLSSANEPAP